MHAIDLSSGAHSNLEPGDIDAWKEIARDADDDGAG